MFVFLYHVNSPFTDADDVTCVVWKRLPLVSRTCLTNVCQSARLVQIPRMLLFSRLLEWLSLLLHRCSGRVSFGRWTNVQWGLSRESKKKINVNSRQKNYVSPLIIMEHNQLKRMRKSEPTDLKCFLSENKSSNDAAFIFKRGNPDHLLFSPHAWLSNNMQNNHMKLERFSSPRIFTVDEYCVNLAFYQCVCGPLK